MKNGIPLVSHLLSLKECIPYTHIIKFHAGLLDSHDMQDFEYIDRRIESKSISRIRLVKNSVDRSYLLEYIKLFGIG